MPPRAFTALSPGRMAEWEQGGGGKENPHQFIIHGEGIFLSGPLYRSLSPHITLSISPDKCQSKGSSPGFFFFWGGGHWRISETKANESAVMEA